MKPKTLFEKIWDPHVVKTIEEGPSVLYIDKHLIHEVTSPQAFKGLDDRGLPVFRPQQIVATADHNVPTENQHLPIKKRFHGFRLIHWKKTVKNSGSNYMASDILTRELFTLSDQNLVSHCRE